MSKRVTAAGNVQRGLFYLEKGDVRGFFFFFFGCCCCNYTFYVSKLKKSRRHQKTIRRERARLTKARGGFLFFFRVFFGTLDFLRNYINSDVFKSVFRRQKGEKL